MSELRDTARNYLALRRAVGFRLARTDGLLDDFVTFVEVHDATHVTVELAVAWATQPVAADAAGHYGPRCNICQHRTGDGG